MLCSTNRIFTLKLKIVVLDEIRAKRQSTKLVTDDTWANLGRFWAVSGDGRIRRAREAISKENVPL